MEIKEPFTLEELIDKETKAHQANVKRNEENISKVQIRIAEAEGEEKQRLESLLSLHLAHKEELETVDPVAQATARYEQSKPKP